MSEKRSFSHATEVTEPSPFVKWAGGKSQLLSQYSAYFPEKCDAYFEPFVGGGAVFFHLRHRESFADSFHISDANEELILTYQVVRDEPEELLQYLRVFEGKHQEYGKKFYYDIRAWDRSAGFKRRKKVARAARFIYLNKTCYNGLWRGNSAGQVKVPMGRYKNPNIVDAERIQLASRALDGVKVTVSDFEESVRDAKAGDFVYLDPPYVPLNGTSNFTSYYSDGFDLEQQRRLADLFLDLHRRGCKVMLSNSETEIVRELYQGLGIVSLDIHKVFARRQINSDSDKRGEITELVITNYCISETEEQSQPSR